MVYLPHLLQLFQLKTEIWVKRLAIFINYLHVHSSDIINVKNVVNKCGISPVRLFKKGRAAREKYSIIRSVLRGQAQAPATSTLNCVFFFYRAGIRRERISDENFTACRDHTILFLTISSWKSRWVWLVVLLSQFFFAYRLTGEYLAVFLVPYLFLNIYFRRKRVRGRKNAYFRLASLVTLKGY